VQNKKRETTKEEKQIGQNEIFVCIFENNKKKSVRAVIHTKYSVLQDSLLNLDSDSDLFWSCTCSLYTLHSDYSHLPYLTSETSKKLYK